MGPSNRPYRLTDAQTVLERRHPRRLLNVVSVPIRAEAESADVDPTLLCSEQRCPRSRSWSVSGSVAGSVLESRLREQRWRAQPRAGPWRSARWGASAKRRHALGVARASSGRDLQRGGSGSWARSLGVVQTSGRGASAPHGLHDATDPDGAVSSGDVAAPTRDHNIRRRRSKMGWPHGLSSRSHCCGAQSAQISRAPRFRCSGPFSRTLVPPSLKMPRRWPPSSTQAMPEDVGEPPPMWNRHVRSPG